MDESLLDIVFEDEEVVFRNILGYRVGGRRKTTDIWGKDPHVVYYDEFGKVISSAREIRPLLGGTPYVEFYDKDGKPKGRAYVTEEILSGRRKVEYTTNDGKTISTRYVDEEKVRRNNAISMETSTDLEKDLTGSPKFKLTTPLLLCCVVFLGIGLNALFSFFHARMDTIIRYGSMISVYVVCPLMVVIFLLRCRVKNPPRELRIFRLVHLLLYTAGFVFVAYMTDTIYADRDIHLTSQISSTAVEALMVVLLCFGPTLVFGIVSGIWTLLSKKRDSYKQRVAISRWSMSLMQAGNLILIAVALAIVTFGDAYGSGGFSGLVGTVVLLFFLTLLLALFDAIAYLPYKLLSGKY